MSSRRWNGTIIRTDNARDHDSEAHRDYAARSRVGELGKDGLDRGES